MHQPRVCRRAHIFIYSDVSATTIQRLFFKIGAIQFLAREDTSSTWEPSPQIDPGAAKKKPGGHPAGAAVPSRPLESNRLLPRPNGFGGGWVYSLNCSAAHAMGSVKLWIGPLD